MHGFYTITNCLAFVRAKWEVHTVNYKALLTSAGEGAHGGFRKWEIITESPVLITGFGASEAKQI